MFKLDSSKIFKQRIRDQIASKRVPENIYFCFFDYAKAFDCVDHNKLWKILQEMGIPDELFQILKDDAVKCCTQYASKLGKLSNGHRTGKGQFSFQSQRKAMPKNIQTIALISHASKVMLKILQARLQEYVNRELPDVQAGFRKGRQIANNCWIIKKAREFQKNIYFFINCAKAFDCVDHNILWKILQEMGLPTT